MRLYYFNFLAICKYCGDEFTSHAAKRDYCYKPECAGKNKKYRLRKWKWKELRERKAMKKNKVKVICLKCDREFIGKSIFNRICPDCKISNGLVCDGENYGKLSYRDQYRISVE